MQNVTLIGIDLGKHSFHVHCQDKSGNPLLRKKFTQTKLIEFLAGCSSATVVMEATADRFKQAHHKSKSVLQKRG